MADGLAPEPLLDSARVSVEGVFERLLDAVAVCGRDGRILYANPPAIELASMAEEAVVGSTLDDAFGIRRTDELEQAWAESARGPACRVDVETVDGRLLEAQIISFGESTACVLRDVTFERESRRRQDELRSLFDQASDGIFLCDRNGVYTDVNEAGCRMLGYDRSEIIGRRISDLVSSGDRDRLAEGLDAIRAGGESFRRWRLPRKDGSFVHVEISAKVLEDGRMQGIVRDVSGQIEFEESLQASEERYRALVESASQIVWTWNPHTQAGDFAKVQEWWAGLTGMSPDAQSAEEQTGWFQAILEEDREQAAEAWNRAIANGEPYHATYRLRCSNGEIRQIVSRAVPLPGRDGTIREYVGLVEDITDRLRVETALGESEARLRLALKSAKIAVFRQDRDLRYEWIESPLGMNQPDRIVGLDGSGQSQEVAELKRRALETGVGVTYETSLPQPDGSLVIARGWVEPTRDEKGAINGLIGAAIDLTDVRRAEEALRSSEQRYRALTELMPELVWTSRPDGSFDYCNERWLEYSGLTAEQLLGDGWTSALHPDDRDGVTDAWSWATTRGMPFRVELRLRGRSGEYRWFLARALPMRDDAAKIVRWIGTCSEIEEFKRAVQALHESEALLRIAVDAGRVGTWHWDIRANRVSWSDRIFEFHGIKRHDEPITVEDFAKVVHPDDLPIVQASLERSLHGDEPYTIDFRTILPNGDIRWLAASARVLRDEQGEPLMLVGATADITERKRYENALNKINDELETRVRERTAALEAANREMEGFTYSVSHDLRAPLRAIMSTSMILLEDLGPKLDDGSRRELERQATAAKKLAKLIDDLLAYSRLGRRDLTRFTVDLSDVAATCISEIVTRYSFGVAVTIQPGVVANADPNLMAMLLYNLLENAFKFTAGRGNASVAFGQEDGTYFVRDNGVGFDMQYVDKIFMPFERLHRDADYPGTGIGLANVKRIVERHGGHIWCDSKVDHGTTFYWTLG